MSGYLRGLVCLVLLAVALPAGADSAGTQAEQGARHEVHADRTGFLRYQGLGAPLMYTPSR
jgi:hypothetical protein